jgi:hypothetical protein
MDNDKTKEEKAIEIIVNATPHEWTEKEISYQQVVNLAYPDEVVTEATTYKVGYKTKNETELKPLVFSSSPVKVKKDMVFNVAPAGRA